jgi:hypothetical protein
MSSSTVRFRRGEFSAHDLPIELCLLEVVRQIDDQELVEPWLRGMRDEWHLQATSGFGFGVAPALDRFVTTDARRVQLVTLFRRALASLANRASVFTPEELSELGVGGPDTIYSLSYPTNEVIDVGTSFLRLLTEEPAG